MLDEKDKQEAAGTLTYNRDWHSFALDGYELQCGESIAVSVFGYWIPGQLALDAAGWYLFTLDHVSIRLQSGLPARWYESSGASLPPLVHAYAMQPPTSSLLTTIQRCFKRSPKRYRFGYPKRRWIHLTRLTERSS
jgi:Domain of unknown function (DUF5348)